MNLKRYRIIPRVLAIVGLLAVTNLPVQNVAQAQPVPPVTSVDLTTTATVGNSGAGATMYIECAWEVVDTTPTTAAFDYGPNDDNSVQDQTLVDGTTTANAPCTPTTATNMTNFKRHSIQIQPNPDDDPIERQYQKWVAVESTSVDQIGDVFWKVWEPYVPGPPGVATNFGPNCPTPVTFSEDPTVDGLNARQYCFKYQHHATATQTAVSTTNPLVTIACADLQSTANSAMFQQAINNGEMTIAERDAIINRCFQNEKRVFRVTETISKEQPCGEYRIETTVVNTSGSTTKIVNYFDVICFVYLQTDFTKVTFGTIQNNAAANISGDFTFDAPDTGPLTVRNVGNTPMYLEGGFDPLVFSGDPTKNINQFDMKLRAQWNTDPSKLTTVDPLNARDAQGHQLWACFGDQPIGSNQNGKLDLSVHPTNAQAGDYTGKLHLVARTDCTTAPRLAATNPNNPNANKVYFY